MNKAHQIIFSSIVVLTILSIALFSSFKSFTVFPVDDIADYEVGTYHETMDTNWTVAKFDVINKKISFSILANEELLHEKLLLTI